MDDTPLVDTGQPRSSPTSGVSGCGAQYWSN